MKMILVTGKEFAETCRRAEVGLDERLEESLLGQPSLEDGEPTQLLGAIRATGDILMSDPAEVLATKRDLTLSPHMRLDAVARHLTSIINYSRKIDRGNSLLHDFGSTSEPLDACPAAEYYFLETIDSFEEARLAGGNPIGSQIIMDGKRPLMVRKSAGLPTALTLEPITVDGIPYPAGSIVNARLKNKPNHHKAEEGTVYILSAEEIAFVGFLRLSAFALNPFRRRVDFCGLHPYQIDEGITMSDPNYMKIKIKDIGRIAALFAAHQLSNGELPLPAWSTANLA